MTPSVPLADGPWLYYTRHREGGQQPLFCRRASEHSVEEIMLDGDAERGDRAFFRIDEARASPDHAKLAWSSDAAGSELHVIRVRDLATGVDADDLISDTDGAVVWMSDGAGFYYVRVDENHRTCEVLRHLLGRVGDELVFAEGRSRLVRQAGAYRLWRLCCDQGQRSCRQRVPPPRSR